MIIQGTTDFRILRIASPAVVSGALIARAVQQALSEATERNSIAVATAHFHEGAIVVVGRTHPFFGSRQ